MLRWLSKESMRGQREIKKEGKEVEFEGKTISGKVSALGGIEPRGGKEQTKRGNKDDTDRDGWD